MTEPIETTSTIHTEVIPYDEYGKNFAAGLEYSRSFDDLAIKDLLEERRKAWREADREYQMQLAARRRLLKIGMGGVYRGVWFQHAFYGTRIWVPALGKNAYFDLQIPGERKRLDQAINSALAQRGLR